VFFSACRFIDEIVHLNVIGATFSAVVAASILVEADKLLLFGIDRDHRLSSSLESVHLPVDIFELFITIRMIAALFGFTIDVA